MPTEAPTLDEILEAARGRLGKTWEEMAELLGCTDAHIHHVRSGLRSLKKKRDLWVKAFELTDEEAKQFNLQIDLRSAGAAVLDRIARLEERADRHAASLLFLAPILMRKEISKMLTKQEQRRIASILKHAD